MSTPGFPLAPPPPDFTTAGTLPGVAAAFAAHVAAEDRRSWVAPSSALRFGEDGRVGARHYPAAPLEEGGLRGLLVYYNERFPRATPLFCQLSPGTAAAVWSELFDATDPRTVKVCERGGNIYGVTPPSYATEYDVADVVRDVAAILGGAEVPCGLSYAAATCDVSLLLEFEDFDIRVDATDRYGEDGARVRVFTKDGTDLGDPLPTLKKRKSAANGAVAGATIAEGMAAKFGASVHHFNTMTKTARAAGRK
jgi:hypothetical protein